MFVQTLVQEGTLNVYEKSWHANSYCRPVNTSEYMKEGFLIKIETQQKTDLGTQENVH